MSPAKVRDAVRAVQPEPEQPQQTAAEAAAGKHSFWLEFVYQYMRKPEHYLLWKEKPEGVRALARAMSMHQYGTITHEKRFTGIASEVVKTVKAHYPRPPEAPG